MLTESGGARPFQTVTQLWPSALHCIVCLLTRTPPQLKPDFSHTVLHAQLSSGLQMQRLFSSVSQGQFPSLPAGQMNTLAISLLQMHCLFIRLHVVGAWRVTDRRMFQHMPFIGHLPILLPTSTDPLVSTPVLLQMCSLEHCDLLKTEVRSLAPRTTSEALSLAICDLVPGYLSDVIFSSLFLDNSTLIKYSIKKEEQSIDTTHYLLETSLVMLF